MHLPPPLTQPHESKGRHKVIGINDVDFRDGVASIGTKPYEILLKLFNFGVEFMGNIIEDCRHRILFGSRILFRVQDMSHFIQISPIVRV